MSDGLNDTNHRFLPKLRLLVFCLLAGWLLGGCLPTPTPLPTLTPTPTAPTLTPTASPVWFPPTLTPTPFLTPTPPAPTPDLSPWVGELLLNDTFEEPDAWLLTKINGGVAAFGKNELSLVITTRKVYVSALRLQPTFTDFYLEITANPVLCRGLDEYGLLLRTTSASNAYRLSLSCDGQARLDRIAAGSASSPVPWTLHLAVPPGAPSITRLAVWMSGRDLRFFANDFLLFEVRDPLLSAGGVGVFARSASDEPVTVNFSNLQVYAVEAEPPSTTPTP